MIGHAFALRSRRWIGGTGLAAALVAFGGVGADAADLAVGLAGEHGGEGGTRLAVELAVVRSGEGALFVAIHGPATEESFPEAAGAVAMFKLPAEAGPARFAIRGLAPGTYAIAAFHDENDNGELDAGLLGIPTEGYGFSNDAPSTMGPASFEDAAFDLGGQPVAMRITLDY